MAKPWLQRAVETLADLIPKRAYDMVPDAIVERFPLVQDQRAELRSAELRASDGIVEGPTAHRDRFQRAITYYDEGRYDDAKTYFRSLQSDPDTVMLGPTKFIYRPSEQAQRQLGIYQPIIVYDELTRSQHRMYVRANEFLDAQPAPNTYRVLSLRTQMSEMIVAEFVDAMPAAEFLTRHPDPDFTRVLYDHCVEAAGTLHEGLFPEASETYDHEAKLVGVFNAREVDLGEGARDPISAIADVLATRKDMLCVDRTVSNHFVDLLTMPAEQYLEVIRKRPHVVVHAARIRQFEPIYKLMEWSSEEEALASLKDDIQKKRGTDQRPYLCDTIITHDFETLDTISDPGHILGDIVVRSPYRLREVPGPNRRSLEEHVTRSFADRMGVSLDGYLALGLTVRAIRMAGRFGLQQPHITAHAAELFSSTFDVSLQEQSLEAIAHALDTESARIRAAARSPSRLSAGAW